MEDETRELQAVGAAPRLLDYVTEADLDRFVDVLATVLLAEAREAVERKSEHEKERPQQGRSRRADGRAGVKVRRSGRV